jgi:GntR family transcriptional repressor for pyruvate dehydrogenase complex
VLAGHLSAALLRLMHDNIRLNLGELRSVPAAGSLLMRQHEAIRAAIRERKPQAARAAAETHIDFVRETLAQSLRAAARRETAARRLSTEFSALHHFLIRPIRKESAWSPSSFPLKSCA